MRLFHVSEDPDIHVLKPRLPKRTDLDQNVGLVWAIDEARLPNFLTPRECPRVAYRVGEHTTDHDKGRFFTSSNVSHSIVIENRWFDIMRKTRLFLYEFNAIDFKLLDKNAGYYVSTQTQYPMETYVVDDLFSELIKRNVEIRITENLWDIADAVKTSTLQWSLCRMRNAKPRH